jgi:D-beta-D-heptose 7-phosphate kinase / D-beta-D-heptose 1-phosphate adenosyltransferase
VAGVRLVKPNRGEAGGPADVGRTADRARALRERWGADGVVVTLGSQGALLVTGDPLPIVQPAAPLPAVDVSGAGDAFSVAAAGMLADGASLPEAVAGAVRAASAFVASGGAAAFEPGRTEAAAETATDLERARTLVAETRARGGRVVATGGCFDLLHAGHVSTLSAARALGECLVVLLNSDRSVRELKGRRRPLVPEADRAAVLSALACVDAVVTFDEPMPAETLRQLRPDLFVKGGDYAGQDLLERAVMAEWGGDVVILPYLEGRSTTRMVESARAVG